MTENNVKDLIAMLDEAIELEKKILAEKAKQARKRKIKMEKQSKALAMLKDMRKKILNNKEFDPDDMKQFVKTLFMVTVGDLGLSDDDWERLLNKDMEERMNMAKMETKGSC